MAHPGMFRPVVVAVMAGCLAVGAPAQGAPNKPGFKKEKGEICAAATKTANGTGGFKSVRVCVSEDGNVKSYGIGSARFLDEGYRICHQPSLLFTSPGSDLGPGPGTGFLDPTITAQPNGDGTLPVTIVRSTSDGAFTLTQTFALGTGDDIDLYVTMSLLYRAPASEPAVVNNVRIVRSFDRERPVLNPNVSALEWYLKKFAKNHGLVSTSVDSAFGWTEGVKYGLMLRPPPIEPTVAYTLIPHETGVRDNTSLQTVESLCSGASLTIDEGPGDFRGVEIFNLGSLCDPVAAAPSICFPPASAQAEFRYSLF